MKGRFVSLSPRPGITQNLGLMEPGDAFASAVLFAGGPGVLGISEVDGGVRYGRDINFLVRSRMDFASHGLMVAVVDTPSARSADNGPLCPHRFFGIEPAVIDRIVTFMRSCMTKRTGRETP